MRMTNQVQYRGQSTKKKQEKIPPNTRIATVSVAPFHADCSGGKIRWVFGCSQALNIAGSPVARSWILHGLSTDELRNSGGGSARPPRSGDPNDRTELR